MPLLKSRINKFALAIEAAENHRRRYALPESLHGVIHQDAAEIETHLAQLIERVNVIQKDERLSQVGKQEAIDKEKEVAGKAMSEIFKAPAIEKGIKELDAQIINRVTQVRQQYKPADSTVDYFEKKEIRDSLRQLRQDKLAEHEAMLQDHEQKNIVLPDQMRSFNDPVEHLYLQACKGYGPDKEQLIRAVESAPFPIEVLPQETIEKGSQHLNKAIAGDLVSLHKEAVGRLETYDILFEAAAAIVESPEKVEHMAPTARENAIAGIQAKQKAA